MVHGVTKSRTWLSDWTEPNIFFHCFSKFSCSCDFHSYHLHYFHGIKQNQHFIILIIGSSTYIDWNMFSHMSVLLLPGTIQYKMRCIKNLVSLGTVVFYRRLILNAGKQPDWEQVSLIQSGIQQSQDLLAVFIKLILFLFQHCSKYLGLHGLQLRSQSVY